MRRIQATTLASKGKKGEDAWTAELMALLKDEFPDAIAFPIHHRGKDKPDGQFTNGGLNLISAKIVDERAAERSAHEYQFSFLNRGEELGEVFAVTYPDKQRGPYHLYVLPSSTHRQGFPLTLASLGDLVGAIEDAVQRRIDRLAAAAIPPVDEARRKLVAGAIEMSSGLAHISVAKLEEVFGGHDFFFNCLDLKLKSQHIKMEVLRQGPAHLFASQLLFYALLSEAENQASNRHDRFPPISEADSGSPRLIHEKYFSRVSDINYYAIYGINVGRLFSGRTASVACVDLVHAIAGLVPRLETPDLIGQVFQTLIPPEIRKPLGAHFTNPRAAQLLANLVVKSPEATVMDPACGSGTLLISAYRQKRERIRESGHPFGPDEHRRFLERQITGIDAIAIAGHLAAVNLASQLPLVETSQVRVARVDSTKRKPGETIEPGGTSLPEEFRQGTLHDFEGRRLPKGSKKRIVQVSQKPAEPITLNPVDVILMNPPFTAWDNMQQTYREALNRDFSQRDPRYKRAINERPPGETHRFGKVSQQLHFILLADSFVKPGGHIGAVLPLTTFTGTAFYGLVRFIDERYTIQCIVYGLGRASFSEQTALTEVLFVARKSPPPPDHKFVLAATKVDPDQWTAETISEIARACTGERQDPRIVVSGRFAQQELLHERMTLTGLSLGLTEGAAVGLQVLLDIRNRPDTTKVGKVVRLKSWMLSHEHMYHYGPKALFVSRAEGRAKKDIDRLVFARTTDSIVELEDRFTHAAFMFPLGDLAPALRRFSDLQTLDISGQTDFVVARVGPALETCMSAYYTPKEIKVFLRRLTERRKVGDWNKRVRDWSSSLLMARRLDLSASGTILLAVGAAEPVFLSGDGWMLMDVPDKRSEAFLLLWLNSSIALLDILCGLTVTRGTWSKLESFLIDRIVVPDMTRFSEAQWSQIMSLYASLKDQPWPTLMAQFEPVVHPNRKVLDDSLLRIIGVPDPSEKAEAIRKAAHARMLELRRSMKAVRRPRAER